MSLKNAKSGGSTMIDEEKRNLTGSDARDTFKQLHKERLPDNCYSLDIDFAFVEKNQQGSSDQPLIAGICDFKKPDDHPTFTEVLAYNQFLKNDIPVFIVQTLNPDFEELDDYEHRFNVYKYIDGDWRQFPPTYDTELLCEDIGWKGFASWESDLRIKRRKEVRDE